MNRQFDVVVLGTGSAGSTVAHACRAAGWQVAIVDWRPFGGTCALRGCDPKKVLVGAAELVDWSRRMKAKSVVTSDLLIDWPALIAFKKSFVDSVPREREAAYDQAGIVAFHAQARFVDRSSVAVACLRASNFSHSIDCPSLLENFDPELVSSIRRRTNVALVSSPGSVVPGLAFARHFVRL